MILNIEARLDYKVDPESTVLLQIEAAHLPDQQVVAAATAVEDPVSLSRVPAEDGIGERCWIRVRGRFACTYTAQVAIDRGNPDLAALPQVPAHELPGEAVRYLMGSRFIAPEKFRGFVDAEFGGLTGGACVAAMRDWIERQLSYVRGSSDETTTAADTIVARQGVCRDYTHVMIALSRAAQIPARMVSVYAPSVEPPDFHAVAEVYLAGAWHLVDATGMAAADEIARIGVGRDAADIGFMMASGACELTAQRVAVSRA